MPVGYAVKASYDERTALHAVGARWHPATKTWHLPLDADLDRLESSLTLFWDMEALRWAEREAEARKRLVSLHRAKDAVIAYPDCLEPYQRVGVRFLADAKRAILADDVGLGKTAQVIRAAMEVNAERVLVVTRKTLVYNAQREILRWAAANSFVLTTKSKELPQRHWVVTNYETVVRRLGELLRQPWDVLILDEAAYVKNRQAERTKAVFKLAQKVPYVWPVTATPTPNGVWELWSLLHIVRPEKYTSFWRFVEQYCYTEPNFFGGRSFLPGIKNEHLFQKEIAPIMLRRTKEVLNLPPVSYETVYVSLTQEQARIYKQLKSSFLAEVGDSYVVAPTVLAQLTRLRQVLCSPALIGGRDESGKTETLLELLEDLTAQHKVLVFTTFAEYARLLEPRLRAFGGVCITGQASQAERLKAVDTFQTDPKCRVLVGTIGAMGEGLNLQAADIVIFANKDWVPSNNLVQAVGRAHRRGQDKPVHVISLVVPDTVDEYTEVVLERKLQTNEAFELIVRRLRKEEEYVRDHN
jgi:SNF2 family DNA or RNA helicase